MIIFHTDDILIDVDPQNCITITNKKSKKRLHIINDGDDLVFSSSGAIRVSNTQLETYRI